MHHPSQHPWFNHSEKYKLQSCSLCSFLYPLVISSFRIQRQNYQQTLKTWKASNCMLRDFSFNIFIISFRLSGFDMYLVITWNKLHIFSRAKEKLNTELCHPLQSSVTVIMIITRIIKEQNYLSSLEHSFQMCSSHPSWVLMFIQCKYKYFWHT